MGINSLTAETEDDMFTIGEIIGFALPLYDDEEAVLYDDLQMLQPATLRSLLKALRAHAPNP